MGNPPFWRPMVSWEHAVEKLCPAKSYGLYLFLPSFGGADSANLVSLDEETLQGNRLQSSNSLLD